MTLLFPEAAVGHLGRFTDGVHCGVETEGACDFALAEQEGLSFVDGVLRAGELAPFLVQAFVVEALWQICEVLDGWRCWTA